MNESGSILEEMEQALQDHDALRDDRGVASPEGIRLSQKTDIMHGDTPLAGRTRAWRTDDGREVWLNTGELPHHLSKRFPTGKRVFVLQKPKVAERMPLDTKCRICAGMNGYSRKFYDDDQYMNHMEILHPREYEREKRNEDRQDRLASRDALKALAERGERNASPQDEAIATSQVSRTAFTCETCGKRARTRAGLGSHQRSHKAVSVLPGESTSQTVE